MQLLRNISNFLKETFKITFPLISFAKNEIYIHFFETREGLILFFLNMFFFLFQKYNTITENPDF